MMFNNLLASVRIGAAEVDTLLDQEKLYPGDDFSAQIVVKGGEVDQKIEGLELRLTTEMCENRSDSGASTVIDRWMINDEFTIRAGEEEVIPLEAKLHLETPVTAVGAPRQFTKVWIETGLAIDAAIDAKDKDYLTVLPTPPVEAMLQAVERCGLSLNKVSVDNDHIVVDNETSDLGCDQEFEFRPTGKSRHTFDESEVHFMSRSDHTKVLLEFDKRDREIFRTMTIDHDNYSVESLAEEYRRQLKSV
jgi:sporulation-control protein